VSSSGRDRDALFERVRGGDRSAHTELCELARAFARQICRGGGPSGAPDVGWEDVAQEALRKLLSVGIDRYRGTGSEKSYLYTIVKSTMIAMSRSARRRQAREESIAREAISVTPNPGHRVDVEQILAGLSDDCRGLLERAFLHGASYRELAGELGMEESSVRAKLSRCLRKARLMVQGGGEP
jgi:RNA polymerase sigma factor (sigma-70 family)